jgi:hypothetical protein
MTRQSATSTTAAAATTTAVTAAAVICSQSKAVVDIPHRLQRFHAHFCLLNPHSNVVDISGSRGRSISRKFAAAATVTPATTTNTTTTTTTAAAAAYEFRESAPSTGVGKICTTSALTVKKNGGR